MLRIPKWRVFALQYRLRKSNTGAFMKRVIIAICCLFIVVDNLRAQQTIDQLGIGTALTGPEKFPMFQGSNPATATTANAIKTFVGSNSGVSAIDSFTGGFTLGAGLSVNVPWVQYFAPATPVYNPNNNVITQTTGRMNVLRNATMTSNQHHKFMTKDDQNANPYKIGIASFTAAISGTNLTVASAPTGNIQLFQRVTDATNFTTNALTAVGGTVLHFASTTGIVAGMYVTDLTNPRAISGKITVSSTTGTTVTLSAPVGFQGNLQILQHPGVASGDVIAFSTVLRGTQVVGLGTCGATPSYPCNYIVNVSQTVASESMQSAGGWATEGIYIIPVGTAGTANYVSCINGLNYGNLNPSAVQCTVTGSLSDVIMRFPIDYVDSSRITCMLWTGPFLNCGYASFLLPPMTFQVSITYATLVPSAPSLDSKISCPLDAVGTPFSNANVCEDDWKNATYDLSPVTLPACNLANTPVQCIYAYTWIPTGVAGDMEINFHYNALTSPQYFIIDNFELKQTPGATCSGTVPPAGSEITFAISAANATTGATYSNNGVTFTVLDTITTSNTFPYLTTSTSGGSPTAGGTLTKVSGTGDTTITFAANGVSPAFSTLPCMQLYPGLIEIPDVVSDIHANARFAQLIGSGSEVGINPGNLGAIETTAAFASSTTSFLSTWPLPVTMRCDVWSAAQKTTPRCPTPNIYFENVTDYLFRVAGGTQFAATALAAGFIGLNSIQINATSSGMTAGQPGYVLWGAGQGDMILIDSSIIGD